MKILYSAIDQAVPGRKGGSVHVQSVAEGLAERGHDVRVLVRKGDGTFPGGRVRWTALGSPLGRPHLRLLLRHAVRATALSERPDVVIERYHNFGGEGVLAAAAAGAAAVLEVNAPVIDYPGSPKRIIDRALLFEPMRRWRDHVCRLSHLIVTPSAGIVPRFVGRDRILEIEWGADTGRFRPDAAGPVPFERHPGDTIIVFTGAFRAWHGAVDLVRAVRKLRAAGRRDIRAVLVGEGPELGSARAAAEGDAGIVFTGALPHTAIPACLAASDVGAAPFDCARHPPLALGFYWSPLKVFEYMAAGLPIVAPAIERLRAIARHGQEGLLYDPAEPSGLARALEAMTDRELRARMGRAARERVVERFSWSAHCARLEERLAALARSPR